MRTPLPSAARARAGGGLQGRAVHGRSAAVAAAALPTARAGKAVAAAALPAGHPSRVRLLPRPGGGASGRAPLRGSPGPGQSAPKAGLSSRSGRSLPHAVQAPAQGCRRGGASGRAPPAPRRSRVPTLTHAARALRGSASRADREPLPSPTACRARKSSWRRPGVGRRRRLRPG